MELDCNLFDRERYDVINKIDGVYIKPLTKNHGYRAEQIIENILHHYKDTYDKPENRKDFINLFNEEAKKYQELCDKYKFLAKIVGRKKVILLEYEKEEK